MPEKPKLQLNSAKKANMLAHAKDMKFPTLTQVATEKAKAVAEQANSDAGLRS